MTKEESLIEMCVRIYDPVFKFQTDARFARLTELLKDYPGDLSAYLLKVQNLYEEMYNIGSVISNRYCSAKIDIEVLRAEKKELEKIIIILNNEIDFQK